MEKRKNGNFPLKLCGVFRIKQRSGLYKMKEKENIAQTKVELISDNFGCCMHKRQCYFPYLNKENYMLIA